MLPFHCEACGHRFRRLSFEYLEEKRIRRPRRLDLLLYGAGLLLFLAFLYYLTHNME